MQKPGTTTESQRELFFENPKLLGLGRQIGVKCFEVFGVFLGGPRLVRFHLVQSYNLKQY